MKMLLNPPLLQEFEKQNNVKGSICVCIQLSIDISKRRTLNCIIYATRLCVHMNKANISS